MRKLQSQGVHHITIVGADRQTSIDFWEGVLGMPFVFEQPNLDNEAESHLYFDPGDGRLITVFTNEERVPDPDRTPTDPGCVHHLAFAVSQATFYHAAERLDERGIRHSGVKDRGFMDSIYFEDPLGLLIELASYRFEPPRGLHARRGPARGAQAPGRARRLQHRPRAPRRRDRGARRAARASRSRRTARPRTRTTDCTEEERDGRQHAQHPAAEREQPDRADLRARRGARLRGDRRLGQDEDARVPRQGPGAPDADARGGRPAARRRSGRAARSWPTCATSTGSTSFYPTDPAERAMVDSAMFYLIGTFYPLVARATYPTLGFPSTRARSARPRPATS